MPYSKELETMISLLETVVKRLNVLTGICVALVIIGITVIVVKFVINFITKK